MVFLIKRENHGGGNCDGAKAYSDGFVTLSIQEDVELGCG